MRSEAPLRCPHWYPGGHGCPDCDGPRGGAIVWVGVLLLAAAATLAGLAVAAVASLP